MIKTKEDFFLDLRVTRDAEYTLAKDHKERLKLYERWKKEDDAFNHFMALFGRPPASTASAVWPANPHKRRVIQGKSKRSL